MEGKKFRSESQHSRALPTKLKMLRLSNGKKLGVSAADSEEPKLCKSDIKKRKHLYKLHSYAP